MRIRTVATTAGSRDAAAPSSTESGSASTQGAGRSQNGAVHPARAAQNMSAAAQSLERSSSSSKPRRRRHPIPIRPAQLDFSEKDPLRELQRLSTLTLPASQPFGASSEATTAPPGTISSSGLPSALHSLLPSVQVAGGELYLASSEEGKAAAAFSTTVNAAVDSINRGLRQGDWKTAYERGWLVLHAMEGEQQDRLDMGMAERLVRYYTSLRPERSNPASKVPETAEPSAEWRRVCETLLVPVALREVGNEHRSVVADWVWAEVQRRSPHANARIVHFWRTFVAQAQNRELAKRYGHPFELLQVPTNLYTAIATAVFLMPAPHYHTFSEFLGMANKTIAVPPKFGHVGSLTTAELKLTGHSERDGLARTRPDQHPRRHRQTASTEAMTTSFVDLDWATLGRWFSQLELFRIWQKQGTTGIRGMNARWREKRNAQAAETVWERIKVATGSGVQSRRAPGEQEYWWQIDWRDTKAKGREQPMGEGQGGSRASASAEASEASRLPVAETAAQDEGQQEYLDLLGLGDGQVSSAEVAAAAAADNVVARDATMSPRHHFARPSLPASFTSALVADFLRTFLQLGMHTHAEDVWDFCVKELQLAPTLVMWNALLLGHAHHGDTAAVEDTFLRMRTEGGHPADAVAWSILVGCYFRAGHVDTGLQRTKEMMADKALRAGLPGGQLPIRIYNVIIHSLLWSGNKEAAFDFLDNMISGTPIGGEEGESGKPVGIDIFTVNILLRYYSRPRTHSLAGVLETVKLLERFDLQPDIYTFTTVLDALLRAGRSDAVERVQQIMHAMKVNPSIATYGAMIDHLVKGSVRSGGSEGLRAALELFRRMQNVPTASEAVLARDQPAPEAGTEGIDAGNAAAAGVQLYGNAAAAGVQLCGKARPTSMTYTSLIQGFARYAAEHGSPADLETAEDLHREMLALHIPANRITYNSLMAANLALSNIPRALEHFNAFRAVKRRAAARVVNTTDSAVDDPSGSSLMSEKVPIGTWQALLAGLVRYNQRGYAKNILQEMKEQGVDVRSPSLARLVEQIERMPGGRLD